MEIRINEPMKMHTSFRAGGPAAWYAEPETAEELGALVSLFQKAGLPWYSVGNGSNLLVSDQGYPGLIVSTSRFDRLETEGEILRAGSGVLLSRAASLALKCGLTGFEFAAGIPGTVGGACVMNAGAYGSETKDVLLSATVLTPEGQIKEDPGRGAGAGLPYQLYPGKRLCGAGGRIRLKARRARGHKGPDGRAFRKAQGKAAAGISQRRKHL